MVIRHSQLSREIVVTCTRTDQPWEKGLLQQEKGLDLALAIVLKHCVLTLWAVLLIESQHKNQTLYVIVF